MTNKAKLSAQQTSEPIAGQMAHKIAGFGASGTKIHLVAGDDFKKRGGVRPACQSKVSSHLRNGCWNLQDLTSADEITCAKCRAKYDAMVAAQSKDSEGVASEPTPAPVASEPVADTASKAYSARQLQIIAHFQKVYYQFGRNADTYSIVVWNSADTDFIPQEVAELIENGCEYFSVVYPNHTNIWTSPNYRINKAIMSYIAPDDPTTRRITLKPSPVNIISGHGRTSRNRSNKGQNKAHSSRKVSSSVNNMNIEKNTAKARNWRNMRNLHNATAMPLPTITGAELIARGQQLTVVPKPKPLTRILEGRRAA